MQENNKLLWLGTIVNTHGLKGELRVLSNSDDIEKRFSKNNKIYLNEKDFFTVDSYRWNKKFILLKFKEINDINEAEKLKTKKIFIKLDKKNNNEKEVEFYYYELIGYTAIDLNENIIGKIIDYFDQKSYYSYLIENNGKKTNIPIIENLLENVDKENKKVKFKIIKEEYL